MARGDEQEYGIGYTYTFSAVMAVSLIWRVPARYGDEASAYVKADKKEGAHNAVIPHGWKLHVVRHAGQKLTRF